MTAGYIDEFMHYIRYEKRMSEKTWQAYHFDLDQFDNFIKNKFDGQAIENVELNHIRSWIADLSAKEKLQARTLQRKSSTLKSFYKFLLKKGIISANPAKLLRTPKAPKKLPSFLEQEQTAVLLEKMNKGDGDDITAFTNYLILEILYQTGIRRAELIGLKETDIEFSRGQIRVLGKRNKERLIPVNEYLLKDVEDYIACKRKIFANADKNLLILKSGKKLYDNYVYRVVNESLQKITTLNRKSPHVMRHTFATQISNNGADLNAVKELLGHSSLASTQVYTHTNIEKLKEVYRKAHPKS